jgi:ribosome maturation factor RimP
MPTSFFSGARRCAMEERSEVLRRAIAPVISSLGLDLYDIELAGSGSHRILRVVIDREPGDDRAIDLDAITAATEAVSPLLDHDAEAADALRGAYTLEVTSPGLERTLREPRHFQRALGSTVSVKTGEGSDAARRRGVLVAADSDGFELDLDTGERAHIAYGDVVQARTVFEWGPQEKPGASKKRDRKQKVSS